MGSRYSAAKYDKIEKRHGNKKAGRTMAKLWSRALRQEEKTIIAFYFDNLEDPLDPDFVHRGRERKTKNKPLYLELHSAGSDNAWVSGDNPPAPSRP